MVLACNLFTQEAEARMKYTVELFQKKKMREVETEMNARKRMCESLATSLE